ncbi:GNAT family N-acetyltransferase [Spiractinospora alimapuensis]|uniref:GNAT family N-acetyltransferase n=1 Tax=Spiractinospora alimapuensis TaxID=2820884 RepID=UPI001F2FD33F|nr:GNAT family protein [Spiractinospora alimapuensis]QVQ52798.1 GNAT family N-acetyltransferase [Spiractinospora alimapuensis]
MLVDHFPLYGLRLRTPRLELRLADLEELGALGDVAAAGIHDGDEMPFATPWTDAPPEERARGTIQHFWSMLAGIRPAQWALPMVVFSAGAPIGMQEIHAEDFSVLRSVGSGSWLGQAHQGQGIGTEMRAAVLHLAFAGLGAEYAQSEAFDDNPASLRVSVKLGYEPDGQELRVVRGVKRKGQRFRLTRAAWERHRGIEVEMTGVEPCLPLLGARPEG